MFGTSIHWTTFFYLLVDVFIVVFTSIQASRLKRNNLKRFILLGFLFILYNITGGFLPFDNFPGPYIIQYIITYSVAIVLVVFIVLYLYREYDIVILRTYLSVNNIAAILTGGLISLFLVPYFLTQSLEIARKIFTIPIALIAIYFLWAFYQKLKKLTKANTFTQRRAKLSLISASGIVLLPMMTLIGDFQWLTFTIMNISFYAITAIEVDRYLYFLENKNKMFEVFSFFENNKEKLMESKLIYQSLTRREIEIAVSILDRKSYKSISESFFIAQRTVTKHASNIFKKTGVKNRKEFLYRFGKKK
ncbi:helix-turn-helix domain-containing protein [Aquimarina aggregata]|uniref:helix-turn-helix domain-containing protein n=1 Tax=Aquimarina aggregata TaxID=1642818 RepID=UPI002490FB64|nr:helix-turn-helix transcriptional regulator [Aquimarina aggregata]